MIDKTSMEPQVTPVERIREEEVFAAQIRQAELVGQLMHRLQELQALVRKQGEALHNLRIQRERADMRARSSSGPPET